MGNARFIIVFILLTAGYLSLVRLDNTVFWDDEAETAIVAKNLVKTGRLTGWDGRNLFTYRNGAKLDENLRPIDPPLAYLLTAASFKLLGISTWAGRFPFVPAGLAGLLLLAVILRHDYGDNIPIWLYGAAVLALSTIFLLHIRQCRYYSIAMLFSLLTWYFYRLCIKTGKIICFLSLSISAILMFYSNFLLATAFLPALSLVHLIFHRRKLLTDMWKFSLALGLFAITTIPYAVYYRIWYRPDFVPYAESWYLRKPILLWWNLQGLNGSGILPWLAVAGLVYFVVRHHSKEKYISTIFEWAVLVAGYVLFLSMLSPQPIVEGCSADIRYLIPAIPFSAGLVGVFVWFIHRQTKPVAFAVLLIIVTTNIFSVTPVNWKFQWLLPSYINEIHHSYSTVNGEVIRFLEKNAKYDESVFVWPEYPNPIIFYIGDKVRICCTLGRSSFIPLSRIKELNAPLLWEENFPDWIILLGLPPDTNKPLSYFSRPHLYQGRELKFVYKLVGTLDVFWVDTTRPEPSLHNFGPKTDFDRRTEAVYVMRRFSDKAEL